MNDYFGWKLLALFLINFVYLVFDSYFFYVGASHGLFKIIPTFAVLSRISIYVLNISLMTEMSFQVGRQNSRIKANLLNISDKIHGQSVCDFIASIDHRPMTLNALGIFEIDRNLSLTVRFFSFANLQVKNFFFKVIGSMTSYLFIILQFRFSDLITSGSAFNGL